MSKSSDYTLFEYYSEASGGLVVSAIHWRDIASFLRDYPEATRKVA